MPGISSEERGFDDVLILLCPLSRLGATRTLPRGTRRGLAFDDRATVGAEPRDVGQHPLIRGFTHIRMSVWGCPGLRTGVDRRESATRDDRKSPFPRLRPRRCTRFVFTGPCPGAGSLVWSCGAARSP